MSTATAEKLPAHAMLSASGAGRWMACPPSARLEEQFPEQTSQYAEEGTLAHELAECTLAVELGRITSEQYRAKLNEIAKNELYTNDMIDYVYIYTDAAMEKINEARARTKDTIILLEQKVDFSPWVPEGFGTGDMVIVADNILEVIDLKYGKGVPVSAEDNPQMKLYALGAYNQFSLLYDIEKIKMTVCQPRLDNISTAEISTNELLDWAENELKPLAEKAFAGEGKFKAGEHCQFCRARFTCRERAKANLELTKYEFQESPNLSNEEIAEVLSKAEALQKWVSDVQNYALDQAKNHGVKFPGWKLVEGRSNRKYSDQDAIAKVLTEAGYEEKTIYKPKELYGITDMEKKLGKKKFNKLLGDLVIKPAGKPTLVPESDKRPEISTADQAAQDFNK